MSYKNRINNITSYSGNHTPESNREKYARQSKAKQEKAKRANEFLRVMSGIKKPNS